MASVEIQIIASGKISVQAFKGARKLFPNKFTEDIEMPFFISQNK